MGVNPFTVDDGQPRPIRPRQNQVRLTTEQTEQLRQARAEGATIAQLAERFGIHRTTVMNRLKFDRG